MALEPGVGFHLDARWRRCNWWTHPVFASLVENPSPQRIKREIETAPDRTSLLWVLRAAIFRIHSPGMRSILLECFEKEQLPLGSMELWPHPNLLSRFLRGELDRRPGSPEEEQLQAAWLRALACCWPWLWEQEAQRHGMGEAHPLVRTIRSGRHGALPALFAAIEPRQWIDWAGHGSEKMVSCLLRSASPEVLGLIWDYDNRISAWSHRKDGRMIVHEVAMRLLPELVGVAVSRGQPAFVSDGKGRTPVHVAMETASEQLSRRGISRKKQEEVSGRLSMVVRNLAQADIASASKIELANACPHVAAIIQGALLDAQSERVECGAGVRRL